MTCSEVQRVLPELLDGAPDGAFQTDFDAHLRSCAACSDLVSELKLIESEASQLEAKEEPAPIVWLRIAAQLRAEGLIRDSEPKANRPALVPAFAGRRWSAWWLAPIAAGLVAAGSYVISSQPASHKQTSQVAKEQVPPAPATSPVDTPPPAALDSSSSPSARNQTPHQQASGRPASQQAGQQTQQGSEGSSSGSSDDGAESASGRLPENGSSAEDQQFLSVVSTRAPAMRATYESQLRAVNAFIRESQAYLDRNPTDADARQNLMDAYQQKALLYQIALDRIQ